MKRTVLRLVVENYVACIGRRMPPSGKPLLHDLVADSNVLIAALPANGGPDIGDLEHLDLDKIKACIEWLFTSFATAHSDNWCARLAAHWGRLLALEMAGEILAGVISPAHTLATHPDDPPPKANPGECGGTP